ncbi:MAG: OsmC family protein [Prolixibacteraceae bacterium]
MTHNYQLELNWTGNLGKGTKSYRSYDRSYSITIDGKEELHGSSDPHFRGDASKYNPEEFFLMSLSSCHMLWYLHLCSEAGIVVESYIDRASGTMEEKANGSGRFTEVRLHPVVKINHPDQMTKAIKLHKKANEMCFITNSCNFPIHHDPKCTV